MNRDIYIQLRDILDKMPNGFPSTDDGLEIRILKKIFTEEEAAIACNLKMKWETADAIADRTGDDAVRLKEKLREMVRNGLIQGVTINGTEIFKLAPFVFGVYEYQVYRIDRELAEMIEEYFTKVFGKEFFGKTPAIMRVIPVEKEIKGESFVEPYEHVTAIIEAGKSWAVGECICKKERELVGKKCAKPREVCMGIAPLEHFFDDYWWGRPITKEEALAVIRTAEDAGLVHMTGNTREGHIFICNCCGCCCGVLRTMNELGVTTATAVSSFRAVVDTSLCTACGVCLERCQVRAIDMSDTATVNDRCIGCGLCVGTCAPGALSLVKRGDSAIPYIPNDEKEWNQLRALSRGREDYRDLLK